MRKENNGLWPPLVLLYMVQQVTHKQEVQYYHELYVQNVQYSLDISQYPQRRQSAKDFFLQSCELRHTTPSPAGECVLPPPISSRGGGVHTRLREKGGSQFGREDRHYGTIGINVLRGSTYINLHECMSAYQSTSTLVNMYMYEYIAIFFLQSYTKFSMGRDNSFALVQQKSQKVTVKDNWMQSKIFKRGKG
jgi:hypothetical protein